MSRRQQRVVEEGALRECRYDLDGNLEFDGQRSYAWDGENRLIKVNLLSNHPEERDEVTYAYDYEGRRVRKTRTHHVLGAEGWESTQLADDRYVYDGWNLIAEYDAQASHTLRRTYTWGLDLSLTLQGAGGVGGLLSSEEHAPNAHQGAYYYTYDANGNVTQVLDTTGTLAAHYEYSPFGETVYQSGGYANENPFRFSTKYTDNESGLLYYGYRYYDAETGRWLNRDPIGELAFKTFSLKSFSKSKREFLISLFLTNDYDFVLNKPLISIDFLGMNPFEGDIGEMIRQVSQGNNTYFPGGGEMPPGPHAPPPPPPPSLPNWANCFGRCCSKSSCKICCAGAASVAASMAAYSGNKFVAVVGAAIAVMVGANCANQCDGCPNP